MARLKGSKDKQPRKRKESTTIYTEAITIRVTTKVRKLLYKVDSVQSFGNDAIEQALINAGLLKEKTKKD